MKKSHNWLTLKNTKNVGIHLPPLPHLHLVAVISEVSGKQQTCKATHTYTPSCCCEIVSVQTGFYCQFQNCRLFIKELLLTDNLQQEGSQARLGQATTIQECSHQALISMMVGLVCKFRREGRGFNACVGLISMMMRSCSGRKKPPSFSEEDAATPKARLHTSCHKKLQCSTLQ